MKDGHFDFGEFTTACAACGVEFVQPRKRQGRNRLYCSHECRMEGSRKASRKRTTYDPEKRTARYYASFLKDVELLAEQGLDLSRMTITEIREQAKRVRALEDTDDGASR